MNPVGSGCRRESAAPIRDLEVFLSPSRATREGEVLWGQNKYTSIEPSAFWFDKSLIET